MAEMREACREIGAAVHQHYERTGDRPPPYRFDGVVETALAPGKLVAFDCV